MSPEQRAAIRAHLANSLPASDGLILQLAESTRDYAAYRRGQIEGATSHYGLNLSSFMGERMGVVLRRLLDAETEAERLRASAEGAHRRINAVLDYLATKDATQLSEDAGALGWHIVATLDSPTHPDEEVSPRPALPWRSLLEDVEQSDLVSDLASLFLDYWRGERPDDAATLRDVEQLLVRHRDRSQAAEAARATQGATAAELDAQAEREFAAEAGHAPEGTEVE